MLCLYTGSTHELTQVTVAVEEIVHNEHHLQGLMHNVVNCMNVHVLSTESTHELSQVTVAEEETVTQDKQVEQHLQGIDIKCLSFYEFNFRYYEY